MQKRKSENNPWRAAGMAGAVGADLAVCIVLGYFGGKWVSVRMDNQPIYIAIGALVGLFVGIFTVVMLIRFYVKDSK
ncbi:AtpZ/AtpI family protein [Paenibacillus hemerocallicola]|jgi:membrane protein DedA with SNARE-associated domain|uniref:AtpZ/AtpI family protein n=1 Tax=Paenibacillus hemerocallicola TaxID=1172614 RepID=A0A5C4T770_9BACL|nr:AtpZ/AtpI family protein [Paenibacillus hemerocallicola]TNJ64705.1 AtpZ/AtpI family protein [Paenibacillus hemerocallicola]